MQINLASFNPLAADITFNAKSIIDLLRAPAPKADLLVLPEAALCGCPLFDLFDDKRLLSQAAPALKNIAKETKDTAVVFGLAERVNKESSTALAFIYKGKVTKIYDCETVDFKGLHLQLVLGMPDDKNFSPDPDADIVLFLMARPYLKGNLAPRLESLKKYAKKHAQPALMCNLLGGGDGMIFDGLTAAADKKGNLVLLGEPFKEQVLTYDTEAAYKPVSYEMLWQEELINALAFGLRDYVHKSGLDKVVFGLSGGIDSAFTAALAAKALGGESVYCVSLPSYCTSDLSKSLAGQLARSLGVNLEEIGVMPGLTALKESFAHIVSHPKDATEQELQSRLRTTILGALATEYNAMLLSTDDKSESAVGAFILYGDAGGALRPIGDLYKSEIYELAAYLNQTQEVIPQGIIERAPTSELRPNQKDEDQLPPYAALDKILRLYFEEQLTAAEIAKKCHTKLETVMDVLTRINAAELKRSQTAPALEVSAHPLNGVRWPVIKKINL